MSVLSASDFRRILQLASRPAGRRGWYGEQDDARADLRPLRFRPKHESSQIKNCRRPQVSGWRQCDQMWMTNTEFLLQRTVLLSPGIVFKSCIKVRFSIKAIGPVIRFHYCPFALQKNALEGPGSSSAQTSAGRWVAIGPTWLSKNCAKPKSGNGFPPSKRRSTRVRTRRACRSSDAASRRRKVKVLYTFWKLLLWQLIDTFTYNCSVTRWLDCLFNIWPFSIIIIFSIEFKICQSKLKILPNTKSGHSKWPKFFNIVPEWRNFAKSGHTAFTLCANKKLISGQFVREMEWVSSKPRNKIYYLLRYLMIDILLKK